LISDPSWHKGADVAGKSDTDVERVVAALGAPSMTYRTFRPEPPTPHVATQSQSAAVAFPLLAAALPESASIPMPALPPSIAVANPTEDNASPLQSAEIWSLPASKLLPQEPESPNSTSSEPVWRSIDARRTAPEQVSRRTPLAAMFRMLRAEPTRRDEQPEPRPGLLRDVFRRL
jgi:hypothetical protein